MIVRKKSTPLISLLLVFTLVLSGCTTQNASISEGTTTGIGEVTEVTLITTIEATGSITPRQVADVVWSTSGTIATINVQVGQKVQAGDILMTLDPNSIPDNLVLSQLRLVEITSATSIAEAEKAVLDAQSALDDAKYARLNLDYYNQDVIDNAYAEYIMAKDHYETAKEAYDNLADELDKEDPQLAAAYTAMYEAKKTMDTKEYLYILNKSDSSAQTYAEYDNAMLLAENQLEEAQNYLIALTGGEVPADATGSALMNFRETSMAVEGMNLRAPLTGTVGAIYDQRGMVVSNNQISIELVDRSKLYVTIQLDESDVVKVSNGMSATITVDALPDLDLTGQIFSIEPIGKVSNGVVYYDVQIELNQSDDQIPLNATASVTIQIGEPLICLAVPATAIQNDTVGEYIQVVINDNTRRVDVVSGQILTDDTVVITGDVKVGDQVLLVLQASTSGTTGTGGGGLLMGGGRQAP